MIENVCAVAEDDIDRDGMHESRVIQCEQCRTTSCELCREAITGDRRRCIECKEILP